MAGIFAIILSSSSGGNDANSKAKPASGMRTDPPTRIVATFYHAISRKDFRTAWNLLSPSFQQDGSFDKFRGGYATTQSVSVSVAEVPGAPQKVRASLDAADLINGSTVHSHFEGWWVLTQASDGRWLLDSARFTKTHTDTTSDATSTSESAQAPQPMESDLLGGLNLGDTAVVGSKPLPCFNSPDGIEPFLRAATAGDKIGEQEALADAVPVSPGDHILMLDSSMTPFAVGAIRVRLTSGANADQACWLEGDLPMSDLTNHVAKP
jgi:hypothetical protein